MNLIDKLVTVLESAEPKPGGLPAELWHQLRDEALMEIAEISLAALRDVSANGRDS